MTFGGVTSDLACMTFFKISEKLIGEAVEKSGCGLIDAPFPELLGGTEKYYELPYAGCSVSGSKLESCAYRIKVRSISRNVLPKARYKHVYFF
jgi:hypothetical protein